MSKSRINTGGPAFPIEANIVGGYRQDEGVSKRTWLAGMAVAGGLSGGDCFTVPAGTTFGKFVAQRAYEIADAMLEIERATDAFNSEMDKEEESLAEALGLGIGGRGVAEY